MSNKTSSIKSKLFKLRKWLTIPETAKHLSLMFGEEVTEADILRLGLDGHLKLSVYFVNHAHAKAGGKFLSFDEWGAQLKKKVTWQNANALVMNDGSTAVTFSGVDGGLFLKDDELIKYKGRRHLDQEEELKGALLRKLSPEAKSEFLSNAIEQMICFQKKRLENFGGKVPPDMDSFNGNVITIKGVHDLPMLGAERLDIENEFQQLTGGPEVTLTVLEGAFVENKDGIVHQIQEAFEKEWIENLNSEDYKQKSLDFYRKFLDKRITNNEIDEKEAEKLLNQRRENLNKPMDYNDKFYPAGSLPEDSVLVVRTQALIDLQERFSQTESVKNKPLDNRSETTYLNIIGAMLETFVHRSYGDVEFSSEAKLREFLSQKYRGFKGLTERTLAEKFAGAKKKIQEIID